MLIAGPGLSNVNFLSLGCLGQRLQFNLSLKAPAELPVGVQGAQQRRQPRDLQEEQRAVLTNILQGKVGDKKAVGGLEDLQLRPKEKQPRKQEKPDIRRLAVLRPGQ